MNFRVYSILYFATGICFIFLETIGAVWPGIIVKALIIPVLILMYLSQAKGSMTGFHRMVITALLFSWAGDVLLQLSHFNETYFLAGVASFLATQLIYTVAFLGTPGAGVIFFRRAYLIPPVAAYGFLVLWYIYDGLGDMLIPIVVYAVVILSMFVAALNREEKVNRQSYILVLLGALLFILSDSLIMINKIRLEIELMRIPIMSLYIAAQYLIAAGCLKQYNIQFK